MFLEYAQGGELFDRIGQYATRNATHHVTLC
jgi:hypothetical protein